MDLSALTARYDDYVATYRGADGRLPVMMALKLEHTHCVVRNSELIAAGEGFDARTRLAVSAAALLHDTGRYEQLRRYDTFRDSESVDHAVFSHGIVREKGWLDAWDTDLRDAVLQAVLYHNRREVPEGLDALTFAAAHTVRDADKLDIFRVLEHQFETADWRHDRRAFWDLPVEAPPRAEVAASILERRSVDYNLISSLADFVLIQVGWMISDLQFATTRRLCRARGHLAFRRRFLDDLIPGDARCGEICNLAERVLAGDGEGIEMKGERK